MPFTLAHPAAVLPLRRYCPRWLCFPALVIGSVSPDTAYAFKIDAFSHSWPGSVIFCLPAGMLMLAVFYWFRERAIGWLPARQRVWLLPLCRRGPGPWYGVLAALLIGTWTHLLWDSFTHTQGWVTQHVPVLQYPLVSFGYRELRLHHVLWYISSFGGVAWLYLQFQCWRENCAGAAAETSRRTKAFAAVTVAGLAVVICLVHHVIHGSLGLVVAAILTVLLVAGVAVRGEPSPR